MAPESTIWAQLATIPVHENIPAFTCEFLALIFGLPINFYLIVNLYRRGDTRALPSHAYFIFFRSLVDVYNIFIHPASDLAYLMLNQYTSIPATLLIIAYIFGETLVLLLDLLIVIQWKRKTKSSSELDKLLMLSLPCLALFLFTADVFSFFPFFLSTSQQKEVFSRLADPIANLFRLTVFTLIFVSYFFSIRSPNLTFCTPYAKQSHRRIVKFYQALSLVYLCILFCFFCRQTAFFMNTGTLGMSNCTSTLWVVSYQTFWCLICLAPIMRGIMTSWAFRELLSRDRTVIEPATTLFTVTK